MQYHRINFRVWKHALGFQIFSNVYSTVLFKWHQVSWEFTNNKNCLQTIIVISTSAQWFNYRSMIWINNVLDAAKWKLSSSLLSTISPQVKVLVKQIYIFLCVYISTFIDGLNINENFFRNIENAFRASHR